MSSVLDDKRKKEKKEKTLLKDKEASEIGLIKGLVVDNFGEAREKGSQYRDAKGELQDGFLGYKVNKKTGKEEVEPKATPKFGETAEAWHTKMADARERWDKLAASIGSNNTLYGVKVAEGDRGVPKSVAYLDGTMPRKVAKPTAEQTEAVPAATKEGAPAAPDTQASDDVVALEGVDVFGKRSHKKEPETTLPKNVSSFDSAGTRIPSDNARNAGVKNLNNYYHRSVLETLPETPAAQTPAKETSTPVAQPAATTAQQEVAKDAVPAQPATTAQQTGQQTASEDTPEQMTYTDLLKRFYPVMTPEEKAEQQRRQRNRQIINAVGDGISALANLYYTNKSGVNAYDPSTSLTKAAKERYDKLLAQQREDENIYKELAYRSGVADLEMAYKRQRDAKADELADREAEYKRKRDEVEDGYKKSKEDREIAESNARVEKEEALKKYYEAYADYYNNGGKKPSTSGRGSTGSTGSKDSITLINDDGTKRTFRKADSVDYIHAAYAALPNEYKIQAKDSIGRLLFDKNGNPVYDDNVNQQQMQSAIARYNARKRPTAKASSKKNGGNKTSGKAMPGVGSNKKMPGVK